MTSDDNENIDLLPIGAIVYIDESFYCPMSEAGTIGRITECMGDVYTVRIANNHTRVNFEHEEVTHVTDATVIAAFEETERAMQALIALVTKGAR